ncbi:MAG: hypothetical protein HKM00_07850 [Gallionella sp.]|nr:hypothetical protein [Gallionella sp.]
MASNFNITISAIDKTTATVRKINNIIGKSFRPMANLGRSVQMLGREVGLGKLGSKIVTVGKGAAKTAGHLADIAAPLTAIVGGGSIAGIAALATEWGRLGAETARTATTLGLSTGYLQSMRGAAVAAGLSSDAMTGSLKSLGDTMQDALYGRNQMALSMLSQLGIGIHHTRDGAVDTARAFGDMSRAIKGIKNPQVQGLVARTFGLEAVLPLLRQGPDAIAAYQKKVESLGGVMSGSSVQAAERFGISLNYLKIATEGVRNTIGDHLMPILNPLIDQFTGWISKNRELIATRVAEFVEGFAKWLEKVDFNNALNGITGFIKAVGDAVDWIGGWKVAAIALGAVMAGPLILSVVQLAAGIASMGMGIAGLVLKMVMAMPVIGGFAATFVAAMGSMAAAIAPVALALGAVVLALGAGVAAGMLLNTIFEKLSGGESFGAKLYDWTHSDPATSTASPSAAAPAVQSVTGVIRQQAAASVAAGAALPQSVTGVIRQQAAASVAAGAALPQSVSVDVHFRNAPPGTSASARDSGNDHVPVRVAHAMAGA